MARARRTAGKEVQDDEVDIENAVCVVPSGRRKDSADCGLWNSSLDPRRICLSQNRIR